MAYEHVILYSICYLAIDCWKSITVASQLVIPLQFIPLQLFDIAGGVLRILKLVVFMLLLAHWNGCIQFLIPVLQNVPNKSWIAINNLEVSHAKNKTQLWHTHFVLYYVITWIMESTSS